MFILVKSGFYYAGTQYSIPFESTDKNLAIRFASRDEADSRKEYLERKHRLDYELEEVPNEVPGLPEQRPNDDGTNSGN